jgi:hypothetical protein
MYGFKAGLSVKASEKIGAQGSLHKMHNYRVECEFR